MKEPNRKLQFSLKAILVLMLVSGVAFSRLRIRLKTENYAKMQEGTEYRHQQ